MTSDDPQPEAVPQPKPYPMQPDKGSPQSTISSKPPASSGTPERATSSQSPASTLETSKRATSLLPFLVGDTARVPGGDATPEERFEYVLECAQRVGFNSFDASASQYYTVNFSDTSTLFHEQRLSRSRRLPEILAELRRTSETWTPWERRGHQEEILKTAEQIFAAECSKFSKSEYFSHVLSATHSLQLNPAAKKTFQEEASSSGETLLPNLWALLTALTSSNMALRQRDRLNAVFSSMLLLCCSDRISAQDVAAWLNSCSDDQQSRLAKRG
ncbi:MAG: hypothetical protein M1816_007040 [Peltula sp. TS41687]|nr:MAG: hypothetical protein M1816_007040 [Peltula sp. TS41687]